MSPPPRPSLARTTLVQLIVIVLLAGLCLTLLAIRSFRHPPTAFVDQRARF